LTCKDISFSHPDFTYEPLNLVKPEPGDATHCPFCKGYPTLNPPTNWTPNNGKNSMNIPLLATTLLAGLFVSQLVTAQSGNSQNGPMMGGSQSYPGMMGGQQGYPGMMGNPGPQGDPRMMRGGPQGYPGMMGGQQGYPGMMGNSGPQGDPRMMRGGPQGYPGMMGGSQGGSRFE
jgi:hypothetical protein